MSERAVLLAYVPLVLVLAVLVMSVRWGRERKRTQTWWTSPRRRAEFAEAHPFVGTMVLVFVVSSPFLFLALLQGRTVGAAVLFWVGPSVVGTGVAWGSVWRGRRKRMGG